MLKGRHYPMIVGLLLATLLVTGCAGRIQITYADSDRSLSGAMLGDALADVAIPQFYGTPVADAADLRSQSLAALREKGESQSELADLLTRSFPAEARSVPYYFEEATVDGREAWIVAEVWGSEGGDLNNGRIWAFDRASGDIIASTTLPLR
ncbi:MAG: hypothetical protein M1617_08475 [Actinobacteria bacterium]|nr:hypothetical protein [Actinomycetota bacterium]MCL5888298.1 hypothetical protein [Actinomycetota bacterium]